MATVSLNQAPTEGQVVVAIDFGTSRTGYAWALFGNADEHVQVETLAGTYGPLDVKTPTNVLIDTSEAEPRVVSFGYKAEQKYADSGSENPKWLFFRWFKMTLHEPFDSDPVVQAEDKRGSLALSVVFQKSLEYIKAQALKKVTDSRVLLSGNAHDVLWVLTVPAIWTDWAKALMRRAAYQAGLIATEFSSRLLLALEPECACIASQVDPNLKHLWEAGSSVLIADCGGGTVDITAHKVTSSNPLKLSELLPPDGGNLGSTQVDKIFFDFFEELIGEKRYEELQRKPGAMLALTKEWEEKKKNFEFDESDDWAMLRVGDALMSLGIAREFGGLVDAWNKKHPDTKAKKQGESNLGLSFDLMKSFFMGPVQAIVSKVADVIDKNKLAQRGLKYVVLAGGFANCRLLQDGMREQFGGQSFQVLVGNQPDLLIVKGAAIFGTRPHDVVEVRKSRYTFGVGCAILYDDRIPEHVDHESAKFQDDDGKVRIRIFDIHGRKGSDIGVGRRTPRHVYVPKVPNQETIEIQVLATQAESVFLADEEGVIVLGKGEVPIDNTLKFNDRMAVVEFSFGTTEIQCFLYDGVSGKQLGRVGIDFNFFDTKSSGK
ncbi:hypothetical protein BSKO_08905 [Bryopsis sp. KO-2023]|nr:hypothetical protein BSKO_08905 [Bryopsis sp. KO-2023]